MLIAMLLRLDRTAELTRAVALMSRPATRESLSPDNRNKRVIFLSSHNFYQKKTEIFALYIYQVIETLVKVWENSKRSPVVSEHISSSPNLPFVFI